MSTAVTTQRPMEKKLEDAINKQAAGGITVSAKGGMLIESMEQTMEVAKMMALSRQAVAPPLRENPGMCLAVCIQAYEWQMNPFALANKCYVVNDRLCYEASLYQSVVQRRAPIQGRIKLSYAGEGQTRTCTVWATLNDGERVEYTSPKFATINPKNSPLWKNDPDQQLFYFSVRSFARRHFPDVMMGIYTVDEMDDSTETEVVKPVDARPKADRLLERITEATQQSQAEAIDATVEPTDMTTQHDTYQALSQQIATVKSGKDAATLAQIIAGYLSSNEITQDQADELAARLRKEME